MAKMENLEIIINNDMTFSKLNTDIVSTFLIRYGGVAFPYEDWIDFVHPILGMWMHSLVSNKNMRNVDFTLYFMDGPHRLEVYKDEQMQLFVKAINAREKKEKIVLEFTYDYYDFLAVLYDAYKRFSYFLYSDEKHQGKFEPVYQQTLLAMEELKEVLKERHGELESL